MAIQDILAHVDNTDSGAARLALSVELAKQHDAHLRLLLVQGDSQGSVEAYVEAIKARFEGQVSGLSTEWIVVGVNQKVHSTVDQMVWHARHSDLVVVGQSHPNSGSHALKKVEERLMLEGGRPVLVVPYVGQTRAGANRVMVAWNNSRESVRAVNDAIPLMQRADSVSLLALLSQHEDPSQVKNSCEDMIRHLKRHGIEAETQYLTVKEIDAGNVLLSCLADESINLLVMGGYGHHRFRELVLGGVTREILEHMTVPVLMSH
ncbi:MAG: universal stress protein [Motiliproteus sp.]